MSNGIIAPPGETLGGTSSGTLDPYLGGVGGVDLGSGGTLDPYLGGVGGVGLGGEAGLPTGGSGGGLGGLLSALGGIGIGDLTKAGLGIGAIMNAMGRLSDVGSGLSSGALNIAREGQEATAFKPFTVSTAFGDIVTTPEGGYTTTLTPEQEAIRQQAYGGISGALTGAMGPTDARVADVYERIRAAQRPEESRQRLALEERLVGQGRQGIRTSQFGGTPEQLALAMAQEEAKNAAAVSAIEQAAKEQQQQLGTAQALFELQAYPENQLIKALTPAIQIGSLADLGRREGAGLFTEGAITGLEALAQTELGRANLLGEIYSSILGGTGAAGASGTSGLLGNIISGGAGDATLGSVFDTIGGWFGFGD